MIEFVSIYRFLTDYSTAINYFDLATLVSKKDEFKDSLDKWSLDCVPKIGLEVSGKHSNRQTMSNGPPRRPDSITIDR